MENNWVYIDEVIKLLTLNGVKELHVDTRSFSCLLLDKNSDADKNCSVIRKLIKNQNALEENIIEQADILSTHTLGAKSLPSFSTDDYDELHSLSKVTARGDSMFANYKIWW